MFFSSQNNTPGNNVRGPSGHDGMHPDDTRNLVIFIVASILIFFLFDKYVMQPRVDRIKEVQKQQAEMDLQGQNIPDQAAASSKVREIEEVLTDAPRVTINNGSIAGSINLRGGQIDDIRLLKYFETLDKEKNIRLLSPVGTRKPYYVETGWIAPKGQGINVPDDDTVWVPVAGSTGGKELNQDNSMTFEWNSGQGVTFRKVVSVDDNYLFTVNHQIINETDKELMFYPYSLIAKRGLPDNPQGMWILHEGPISYVDGELTQTTYSSLMDDDGKIDTQSKKGWIGITDKYWMVSLLPEQITDKTFRFVHSNPKGQSGNHLFQTDVLGAAVTVMPQSSQEYAHNIFAGAKKLSLLDEYEGILGVDHFDLAIDFGWFYFLTKPFFYVLAFFSSLTGNFGIAIIMMTVLLRLAVFPLANTSYRSFAKLKKISPQIMELREKHGDDKQKLQQELMSIYEKEKVNPMAGCFPILVQIPIFFALYKVLYVSIEMRHAPFFGWIQDLSAKDPTSVFNLFGALPYDVPGVLEIGAWPCIMMLAMVVQQRLNPPPQDPVQRQILMFFPFFLTFIMASFPAGLVIYWSLSAILSVLQQYVIMRSMGVDVHLFKKTKEDEEVDEFMAKEGYTKDISEVVEDITHLHEDAEEEVKSIKPPKPKRKKKK